MNREQRNLIERFGPQIIEDVIPVDMLPYLLCLTHGDKEVIAHEETRFGPMRAAQELLSRLRRRPDGFEQFLQALNATGCAHLADLLDPREQGNCLDDVTSKIMVEINNNCVKLCNREKFLIRWMWYIFQQAENTITWWYSNFGSNSQKTFFAIVLYADMSAVTSRENREYSRIFPHAGSRETRIRVAHTL